MKTIHKTKEATMASNRRSRRVGGLEDDPGEPAPSYSRVAGIPEPNKVYKDDEYDEEAVRAVMAMTAPQGQRLTFPGARVLQSNGRYDDGSLHYDDESMVSSFDNEQGSVPQQGNPIVAQLAHDDVDDVAARVAERLERRMTERLRQEVEARMAMERPNQYLPDQLADNNTPRQQQPPPSSPPPQQQQQYSSLVPPREIQQAEEAPDFIDESIDDNFKVCGIRRTCWGLLLTTIFLVMTAGLTSMIFHYTNNDFADNNFIQAPSTTSNPTEPPSSFNIDLDQDRWSLLMDRIGGLIVFDSDEDPYAIFRDNSSPQYKAFNWLANIDEYTARDEIEAIEDHELVERYALAVLYYENLGQTWNNQLKFLESISACAWNNGIDSVKETALGIYCFNDRVTFIQLVDNGLKGELPREMGLLTSLVHLNLDKNVLYGELPNLERLTSLEILWLSSNNLMGSLPSEFSSIPSLASLDLEDNNFSGSIPTEWGNSLTNLFFVGLRLNNLVGTLPDTIWQRLSTMRFLDIEGNSFEGTIPTQLGFLTNLESLYMEKNRFVGSLPSELARMAKLTELLVQGNRLTGQVPPQYANLTNLKYFWFHATDLSGSVDGIFCNDPFITSLSGDCKGDPMQVTCSCCTQCCNPFGGDCQQNMNTQS